MRHTRLLLTAAAVAAVAVPSVSAETVDEVIAKHVAARGGKQAWAAIDSLRITGDLASFSVHDAFTLQRKRENKFYLDHTQNGKRVIIAYDGHEAWWDNAWYGPGARAMTGADLAMALRETDFVTPFFDYRERGWKVELLGEKEFEGTPAIAVALTRDDGQTETWYLDPQTYLEVARTSPGSDFGRPLEQRTFYDDFRQVGAVKVPYYVDTQWYTRERIMRVAKVELNAPIDDGLFRMPAPPGMGPLQSLAGDWKVAASQRSQPSAPWEDSQLTSKIEKRLRGAALQEAFTTHEGNEVLRLITYDKFQEQYRVSTINDVTTHLDIAEGKFDEAGRLTVSNVATKTSWSGFGMTFHNRTSIFDITEDGFKTEDEISIDGGQNWFVAGKATYTRATPEAGN